MIVCKLTKENKDLANIFSIVLKVNLFNQISVLILFSIVVTKFCISTEKPFTNRNLWNIKKSWVKTNYIFERACLRKLHYKFQLILSSILVTKFWISTEKRLLTETYEILKSHELFIFYFLKPK